MKKIKRENYLNKIISYKDTPDIKIITGIRRSGKSELLLDYIDYLKSNKNINIIFINFFDIEFEHLKEYHKLNDYILEKYNKAKQNYLFIDEVQLCKNFEITINSLHAKKMFDIYLTGSNAFLLSSDLATLFTGRTCKIEMYPFSFKEYLLYSNDNKEVGFNNYIKYGGMPGSYVYNDEEQKYNYLNDIFDTVILRDLVERHNVKDFLVLENLSSFLMDNISNLTTPKKVSEILANNKFEASHNTIGNYIKYLCESYIFYKAKRYDLKGKKYLATSEKYYLSDHSFRYAKLGIRNLDLGRVYENVVYMELLRRGYTVYIGKLYEKEIDFVATKRNEQIYIQVSSFIEEESTFKREYEPLIKIKDNYPKYIIAKTNQEKYMHDGIIVVDIIEWLLL